MDTTESAPTADPLSDLDTVGLPELLGRLAARLNEQRQVITERWHEALRERLNVRPQRVFPGEQLLDGMPRVVGWLAHSIQNGQELDGTSVDSLRDIAGHWRRGGYSIEESLIHIRALSGLLFDALRDASSELATTPAEGVEAARRLCRGLDLVKVVMVATYRDASEERFSDFGAMLAHEIRGQLNAGLLGLEMAELLEQQGTADPARRAEVLGRVRHSLEQATRIVTSVRALSQAEDGSAEWTRESLREIVAAVVDEYRLEQPHAVELRVAEDIPGSLVPSEPVHLILHNLIDNAVKYADPESALPWVRIHCERDPGDGHVIVHVGDNGLGIPEEEQERIFLRFRRGREASGDGFGLGLAIVRETARKFGGRILLESSPGRGSTFSLSIPADQLHPAP